MGPAPMMRPAWLPLLLLLGSGTSSAGNVCQLTATEDCNELWKTFAKSAVVTLTFDGGDYFLGAKATFFSVASQAKAPVLFAVATKTHAKEIAAWFNDASGKHAWKHGLCTVDPSSVESVWTSVNKLSAYDRPEHHAQWKFAPAALYRVFLRQLFPRLTTTVYMDTDVIARVDVNELLVGLKESFALPLSAARSANELLMRMDYCCNAKKKVKQILANATESQIPEADTALLKEFQEIPSNYREFNNGVMAMDLDALEKEGVLKRVQQWLQLNVEHGILNNDQHAWNLAAWQFWQNIQDSFPTNAPSSDLIENAIQQPEPSVWLAKHLQGYSFLHYTNYPKPWQLGNLPDGVLFDDKIWVDQFLAVGKSDELHAAEQSDVRTVEHASGKLQVLRPRATGSEASELGLLYMEGTGGHGKDLAEAEYMFNVAAKAGVAQGTFMVSRGFSEEQALSDAQRLGKLEQCFNIVLERIRASEDHQMLRQLYQMSEIEYLGMKGRGMIPSCYWRIAPDSVQTAQELDSIFSNADGQKVPSLTPRQGTWLEMLIKDRLKEEQSQPSGDSQDGGDDQPRKRQSGPVLPEAYQNMLLIGSLGALLALGCWVYQRFQSVFADKDNKKKKKDQKKRQ